MSCAGERLADGRLLRVANDYTNHDMCVPP